MVCLSICLIRLIISQYDGFADRKERKSGENSANFGYAFSRLNEEDLRIASDGIWKVSFDWQSSAMGSEINWLSVRSPDNRRRFSCSFCRRINWSEGNLFSTRIVSIFFCHSHSSLLLLLHCDSLSYLRWVTLNTSWVTDGWTTGCLCQFNLFK